MSKDWLLVRFKAGLVEGRVELFRILPAVFTIASIPSVPHIHGPSGERLDVEITVEGENRGDLLFSCPFLAELVMKAAENGAAVVYLN